MKELFEKKQDWTEAEVQQIEYNMLKGILGCRSVEAVEAAITYASYLNFTGITNGNYPVFLNILTVRNHAVIDALLGDPGPLPLHEFYPTELLYCGYLFFYSY